MWLCVCVCIISLSLFTQYSSRADKHPPVHTATSHSGRPVHCMLYVCVCGCMYVCVLYRYLCTHSILVEQTTTHLSTLLPLTQAVLFTVCVCMYMCVWGGVCGCVYVCVLYRYLCSHSILVEQTSTHLSILLPLTQAVLFTVCVCMYMCVWLCVWLCVCVCIISLSLYTQYSSRADNHPPVHTATTHPGRPVHCMCVCVCVWLYVCVCIISLSLYTQYSSRADNHPPVHTATSHSGRSVHCMCVCVCVWLCVCVCIISLSLYTQYSSRADNHPPVHTATTHSGRPVRCRPAQFCAEVATRPAHVTADVPTSRRPRVSTQVVDNVLTGNVSPSAKCSKGISNFTILFTNMSLSSVAVVSFDSRRSK